MRLINFRIKNYKSIVDSGVCWLASDITILAGKNESGKSAILEGLRDFSTDVTDFSEDSFPATASDDDNSPLIELTFECDSQLIEELVTKHKLPLSKVTKELLIKKQITLTKNSHGDYFLDDAIEESIANDIKTHNEPHFDAAFSTIERLTGIGPLSTLKAPKKSNTFNTNYRNITLYNDNATTFLSQHGITEQTLHTSLSEISHSINEIIQPTAADSLAKELSSLTPQFILFSDIEDILPFETPLAEAKDREIVNDFAKIAKLDIDNLIAATTSQKRMNILNGCSAAISSDFMEYWGQHEIKLIAQMDGDKLIIGISEKGDNTTFRPEQRSKGFQWFLSFYLRLNSNSNSKTIILIDEPGLYLHAKAQQDILKFLESKSKDSQIILSTHSPYLIDPNHLDRIRLVTRNDTGTKIENKIHKDCGSETLTPVITAIGLDLSQGIQLQEKNIVLTEGMSDYYYLNASKTLGKYNNNFTFMPCVGASSVRILTSICIAWGLNFCILLDGDKEGRRTGKELTSKWLIDPARVIYISDKSDSIEDIFSRDFFAKHIASSRNKDKSSTNSEQMKNDGADKVLTAKKFYDTTKASPEQIQFDEKTKANIAKIFHSIDQALKIA